MKVVAGEHEQIDGSPNPSFDCLSGSHLDFDIHDQTGRHVGSWCAWCGTGAYDDSRITMTGQPVGFTPTLSVRVPDGFHRHTEA